MFESGGTPSYRHGTEGPPIGRNRADFVTQRIYAPVEAERL
jgi:hypothetical protein